MRINKMRTYKKINALVLAFILAFAGFPVQFVNIDNTTYVYAKENIPDTPLISRLSTSMNTMSVSEAVYSDAEIVAKDEEWLTGESVIHYGSYYNDIRSDVNLPTVGENGCSISWESSDISLIATNGSVTQLPFSYAMGAAPVTLTATITKGEASAQKTFLLEVYPQYPTAEDRVAVSKSLLTNELILSGNAADNVKSRLNLPTGLGYHYWRDINVGGSTITWQSSLPEVITTSGQVIRPAKGQSSVTVTLIATITYESASDTKVFSFVVTPMEEYPLAISYDDFSNTSLLQFNGVSGTVETKDRVNTSITALQFNNDRNTGAAAGGSIFTKNKICLNDNLSFSTAFSYRNPHPDYTTGEGGFAFTLQSVSNAVYGQSFNDGSISPGISIAFITNYYSSSGSGQGAFYGLSETAAVFYNGDYDHRIEGLLTSAATNNPSTYNNVWIEYNGATKILEIRFSTDGLRPVNSNLKVENLDLASILTSTGGGLGIEDVRELYAGFMGSVGNAKDKSEIGSWYLKNDSVPIDFTSYSFVDLSNAVLNAAPPAGQASSTISALVCGLDGSPVAGIPVDFTTSFGSLSSSSAITDASGHASVILSSGISGTAYVKASVPGGATALTEVQLAASDADRLAFDSAWLTYARILRENSSPGSITVNLDLPVSAPNGSTISWESSNPGVVGTDGSVSRPSIIDGSQTVTLTATVSIGAESLQKTFNVTVKVRDEDLAAADRDWLTAAIILSGNESIDRITSDLNLPTTGENNSAISWASDIVEIVAGNGAVNRPLFTLGNQQVTLTATIKMGTVTFEKIFNITVIALEATDENIAYADFMWLTAEIVLNENEGLDKIVSRLNLPVAGLNGSEISWESTNEAFVAADGTINRPTYSQGIQNIALTATIRKGSAEYQKSFGIQVVPLTTDTEAVTLDSNWLTYDRVLGENALNDVTVNLNLPVLGAYGSTINWMSSNEVVIKPDGTVNRPTFTQGYRTVTLTATIYKGSKTVEKSFTVRVKMLEQTDTEAITADIRWLNVSRTLGGNLSQYSINQNLSLPVLAPYGTSITWISDKPSVISANGEVTIPEYIEGHKNVVLTATFTKGSIKESKTYQYTVLSKPDTFAPLITSTTPAKNSANVLWNTKDIIITFDEDIKMLTLENGVDNYGIVLNGSGAPNISASVFKNKLTVNLADYFKPGADYELIIPAGIVSDKSDNTLNSEIKIAFSVEQKPKREIKVVSSSPDDNEKQVSIGIDHITFKYNYSDIIKGSKFENISLLDISDNKVGIAKSLMGDTVTLTLDPGKKLQSGAVYEVSIPADAVADRFENSGIAKSIKFRTETSSILPSIVGFYPNNGQTGVDINEKIKISFSEDINVKDCNLVLLDDKGNKVNNTRITTINGNYKTVFIETPYFQTLRPNTLYTVKGPYDSPESNTETGFEMSFTTGTNALGITNYNTLTGGGLPINTPIEIAFSAQLTKGTEFANIRVSDSNDNEVGFTISVENNKLVLSPDSPLNTSETYAFYIPKGALKNQSNAENDAITIWRTTAERLNYGNYSFYMPSTWVTGKMLQFNARELSAKSRPLKSITWDFGDGKQGSGLYPANIYWHAGNYKVTLTLVDDTDISYKFEKTITINNLNLNDLKVSVYPDTNSYLTVFDDNNQYGIKNVEPFSITLYSPSIGYISDEAVKVSLYKNGSLLENLGNVKTKYNGEAVFSFRYGNKNYFGSYELVFEHSSTKKQVRVPVTISEATSKQSLVIQLYDQDESSFIDGKQDMYFELNGEKKLAQYERTNGWPESCYVIKGLETGRTYSLKLPSSGDVAYVSSEEAVYHQGSDYPVYLPARKKQPGLNYIKSALSDSRPGNRSRGLFINNISIPNLKFELSGNWDGLTPGYYELKSTMGSISLKSDKPVFELQPGLQMRVGEELWGRMVSKSGVETLWQNANVTVAPYPSLGYGPSLNISYINGEYIVDSPLQISALTGGSLDILDGVPLLDSAQSFGLGSSNNRFEGSISENGFLKLDYEYGSGHGLSTKKSKMLTTGYDVEADVAFYGRLYYDRYEKEWNLNYYKYYLSGRGEYYWKRPYTIPKLEIGGWGKVTMGANIDACLAIYGGENDSRDFKGIIEFEPFVSISIGAGVEKTLSVEGYVTGSVPAELHIPTGYIQVEPNINASIVAYYIFDSTELYYKEIARTHWDNGKEKVQLFSLLPIEGFENENAKFTPMPRNYLDRSTQWLMGNNEIQKNMLISFKAASTLGADTNPLIETMTENIYPRAEVQLANGGNERWMVWTEDNPVRDANNRTQLKYSVYRDGSWKEPEWFGQDDTADFAPAVADLNDGILLAWQNIKNVMTDETKNLSFIKDSEISVTQSVCKADGSEAGIITLTDDDKFDHSPVLAADNGKAILVWTKSEGLGLTFGEGMEGLRSPANSDRLFSSVWNGSTWSTPIEIESSLPTVTDSSLTIHGAEGLLLYTLDMDNDQLTQDDREIYYKIYNGAVWSDAVRLTNNNTEDSTPKAVNINGEWFITWYQNGNIMYKAGLYEDTRTDEILSNIPNQYEIAVMEGANPQLAIVYAKSNQDNKTSLSTSFYDIKKGIWSDVITLSENEGYIRSYSPIFTKDGKLNVVYTQAEVIKKVVEKAEFLSPSDKVDLMLLSYTPVHDLEFEEETGLQLIPSIPTQGALTRVSATVKNSGDFAENATLSLYDGNPSEGRLLGEVTTSRPIPARSSVQLEVEWLVKPEERNEYQLYAVVRPGDGIEELNESNNILSKKIVTVDVAVKDLKCENIAGHNYLANTTIINAGSRIHENVTVQLVHDGSGRILETKAIDSIRPGQEIGLSFLFSSEGLTYNEDGEIVMTLHALLPDNPEEFSSENNTYRFTLEPSSIMVDRIDPMTDETQASTEKPLIISFNMNVEKGSGFEQIELIDENLNQIKIYKALEGRTLTITPQSSLAHSTGYTLTVPAEAVSNSYGHKMDRAFSLSFSTTSSNPEVIFAYPGGNMTDIALDTEIKVKFNQNGMKGSTFENITMYTSNMIQVPLSVSIEGEWLYINYSGYLSAGTTYSLRIPGGAVQNQEGEALHDDYTLSFTTIGANDGDGDDSGSGGEITGISAVIGGSKRNIDVRISPDGLRIDLSGHAEDIFSGDENVVINIPAISNVSAYTLEIPASTLAGINGKASLTLNTSIGRITIPSGMLSGIPELGGITANITIATVNQASLSDHVRAAIGNHPLIQLTLTLDGKQTEWNNYAAPVSVSIPYTPVTAELENPGSIVIWFIDGDENITAIPNGCYNPSIGLVTFSITHFSIYAVGYNKVSFNDVKTGDWYDKAVNFIAARDITKGTGSGNFSPNVKLTRGQFIVMLMKAYSLEPVENMIDNFEDAGNTYYTGYIAAAKQLGISNGVGDNLFAPDKEISRQEMFTLLYNVLKIIGQLPQGDSGMNLSNFTDAGQVASWARDAMTLLIETGTIRGDAGRLTPIDTTTRAEMAQVLYNLLIQG